MTLTDKIKRISKCIWVAVLPLCMALASCSENIDNSNLYTFTGETIEDFLTNRSETFSDFNYIIKRAGLNYNLSAYGTYTCFAPTNDAVEQYIDSLYDDTENEDFVHNGMTSRSLEGLSDSLCLDIAKYHISNSKYLTTDMSSGTTISTFLGRDITTSVDSAGQTCINTYSVITSLDNEVENGVVQVINNVIRRSNRQMAGEMAKHSEYSIFYEALERTGLADSLSKTKKTSLNSVTNNTDNYYVPDECKIGYTIFAETNDVLNLNGIKNFDDLVTYANNIYGNCSDATTGWYDYYRDNSIKVSTGNDYTSRTNALNMFIAYHILKYAVPISNLVYDRNQVSSVSLFEYYETMLPYTLFKVTRAAGSLYINRYMTNSTLTNQVARQGSNHTLMQAGILITKQDVSAVNGYIHPINDMLIYNEVVPKGVLNERLRFDDTSFQPELMTNSLRGITDAAVKALNSGVQGTEGNWIRFPSNYFNNLKVYNGDNTQVRYLPGRSNSWSNYQEDEILCIGAYDFSFRLPPVPDGTYELRMGYTANSNRGMVQFYLGNSNKQVSMKALDIPLDMRITGSDVNVGWTLYTSEDDNGITTDKEMHNRGYMRGPLYYTLGVGGSTTGRSNVQDLRRIIVKQQFKQGEYWLRFKTVLPDNTTTQFHLDYIELCPANVYNNTTYVEDMF
jgi:uncharacterized surface protein with fasciclin (FAS1) repeats